MKKFISIYKTVAILLLNIGILFLVINLMIGLGLIIKHHISPKKNPTAIAYPQVSLKTVYPNHTPDEIDGIIKESWIRPQFAYDPFTQFKEAPYKGRFVNINPVGFRLTTPQGPWPPDKNALNIFLFGGSTTFNYGVADNETIATYLQQNLRTTLPSKQVWVYNFGRGYYYSSQELILFERLLVKNDIPSIAIFIDGLNDFNFYDDKPSKTDIIDKLLKDQSNADTDEDVSLQDLLKKTPTASFIRKIPLVRLVRYIQTRNNTEPVIHKISANDEKKEYDDKTKLNYVITRYSENKKMIEALANTYSIKPIFVIQPVPTYNYDLKYHLFYRGSFSDHTYSKYGYPLLKKHIEENPSDDLLWLGDIQAGIKKPFYVDTVHYTAEMSKMIADKIATFLEETNTF